MTATTFRLIHCSYPLSVYRHYDPIILWHVYVFCLQVIEHLEAVQLHQQRLSITVHSSFVFTDLRCACGSA